MYLKNTQGYFDSTGCIASDNVDKSRKRLKVVLRNGRNYLCKSIEFFGVMANINMCSGTVIVVEIKEIKFINVKL